MALKRNLTNECSLFRIRGFRFSVQNRGRSSAHLSPFPPFSQPMAGAGRVASHSCFSPTEAPVEDGDTHARTRLCTLLKPFHTSFLSRFSKLVTSLNHKGQSRHRVLKSPATPPCTHLHAQLRGISEGATLLSLAPLLNCRPYPLLTRRAGPGPGCKPQGFLSPFCPDPSRMPGHEPGEAAYFRVPRLARLGCPRG